MIKVYVPIDLRGVWTNNPYDVSFLTALESASCEVSHGLFRLAAEHGWNIINFHWPESLFSWNEPTECDLQWLDKRLDALQESSRIVVTVHNEQPHYRASRQFLELYKIVYRHASAFVHGGKMSIRLIKQSFPSETEGKIHRVIPIGNYSIFGEVTPRQVARARLQLSESDRLVLVIGAIRHYEEFDMLRSALPYWAHGVDRLLYRASFWSWRPPLNFSSINRHLKMALERFVMMHSLKHRANVIYWPGPVSHIEMADIVSAANVLFIPRRQILNSANVSLGFTYGNVVVGPDIGNVGEILRASGNPSFCSDARPKDVAAAIRKGLDLADSGLGASNVKVAMEEWSWIKIGLQYKLLYQELMDC